MRYLALEQEVDRLWVEGIHDFRYYDDPLYVYNCVNCFCDFSKGTARFFAKWVVDNLELYDRRINEVLDYGCGIAGTSRIFREITGIGALAHYYGVQGQQCLQQAVGMAVCQDVDRIKHVRTTRPSDLVQDGMHWDAVMAFELFEHEREPLKVWDELTQLRPLEPWVVCEASSFSTDFKYGHWPVYVVDDKEVPRGKMMKAWKAALRDRGWILAETGWNGRPHIWVRV